MRARGNLFIWVDNLFVWVDNLFVSVDEVDPAHRSRPRKKRARVPGPAWEPMTGPM